MAQQSGGCGCNRQPKGKGVPGGMIKVSEFVIVSVPFKRQVFTVTEIEKGKPKLKGVVRYLYENSWVDAQTLLQRWQPWRNVTAASLVPSVAGNAVSSVGGS